MYRCFDEARDANGQPVYKLYLRATALTEDPDEVYAAELEKLGLGTPGKVHADTMDLLNQITESVSKNCPDHYRAILEKNVANKNAGPDGILKDVAPQIVMPSDLENSLNLRFVGRILQGDLKQPPINVPVGTFPII